MGAAKHAPSPTVSGRLSPPPPIPVRFVYVGERPCPQLSNTRHVQESEAATYSRWDVGKQC